MALRSLAVDITFDSPINDLIAVDSAVDDIKSNAIGASHSIDDLGSSGEGVGSKLLDSFDSVGQSLQSTGKSMTKWITTPVLGATTAIGGLTTALGFKRLVGMDNAQAKLKGLGYEGEAVEAIMDDVNEAVTGTTHTMADGASVAAGALAAGVIQGEDLERYISLVGDAAIGSNRSMDEMAMIFNRVQGSGKLMTNELNMIEMGMPGFSQAMADHVAGGSLEAFKDMVTAGEIGSDEFLDVMEGFSGGMSEAYSETWSGMKDNVLANIGIIGESLLEGLFKDGKKGLASFLDVLRSEGLRGWAKETGESISNMAGTVVEKLQIIKGWWDGLSSPIQDVIKKTITFGGLAAVALGPVLWAGGKLLSVFRPVMSIFPKMLGVIKGLGGAFGLLANPVGLAVTAIGLVIGAVVLAYNKVDWFRDMVNSAFEKIKDTAIQVFDFVSDKIMVVWDFISDITEQLWSGITFLWEEHGEFITELATDIFGHIQSIIEFFVDIVLGVFEIAWPIISGIVEIAWGVIQGIVETTIDIVVGYIDFAMSLLQGDWEIAWDAIKGIAENIWHNIEEFFSNVDLFQIGKDILQGLIDGIGSMATAVWDKVAEIGTGIADKFKGVLKIFSPSRLFEGFGVDTMLGFNIGFEDEADKTIDTVDDVGHEISDSFSTGPGNATKTNYNSSPVFNIEINLSDGDEESIKRAAEVTKREFKRIWEEIKREEEARKV